MCSDTRSKVARLIESYERAPLGAGLEAAWLGEAGERQSPRDLADRFNRALLLSAIREADMDVVDGVGELLAAVDRLGTAGFLVGQLVDFGCEFVSANVSSACSRRLSSVRSKLAGFTVDPQVQQVVFEPR